MRSKESAWERDDTAAGALSLQELEVQPRDAQYYGPIREFNV